MAKKKKKRVIKIDNPLEAALLTLAIFLSNLEEKLDKNEDTLEDLEFDLKIAVEEERYRDAADLKRRIDVLKNNCV